MGVHPAPLPGRGSHAPHRARLRLESCEDRSLPSALAPLTRPPTNTAHTSTAAESAEDEATEYANSGQPVPRTSNQPTAFARALVPEYVVVAYPAIPPVPTGPAVLTTPAVTPAVPPAVPTIGPVVAAIGPPSRPNRPDPPPPAPAVHEQAAAAPQDNRPDGGPVESPGPPAGSGDQPAILDGDFPPVGPVSVGLPGIGELDLRVNLAGWTATAGRLLDGLDGVANCARRRVPMGPARLLGTGDRDRRRHRRADPAGATGEAAGPLQGPPLPVTR